MIVKEKYAGQRIDSIIRILENETAAGRPKDFDIRVDELKVVPRTHNIEEFLNHEEFINAQTQSVSITLYEGNSRHYTRYVLMLKEETTSLSEQQKTLAGIESTINEKIQQQRNQWEKELLEQELKKNQRAIKGIGRIF